ncbi:thermonuclease family protein [Hyphococcus sp. DH-69]|uniref:thermonuclease family protein n=1 Tax=Hyphococcus formosus TaxID=3143534 RepID=UPI00398ADC26
MRRRSGFSDGIIGPIVVLGAIYVAQSGIAKPFLPAKQYEGVVARVVDGDTLYLSGVKRRIRLWGLDAPERHHAMGPAATAELRRLVNGRRLVCKQIDTDKYGRIVGQCFRSDGSDVTALMIKSGKAREYTYFSGGYYAARSIFARDTK